MFLRPSRWFWPRVSVQGVESFGGHFATLCRGFGFYEAKENSIISSKGKGRYFYAFNHFQKEHKSTTMTPNLPE